MAKEKTKAKTKKPAAAKPVARTRGGASSKEKVRKAVDRATKLAANPAVTEVVAATLVAAAAALRDPKKARALASEAATELGEAARKGAQGGALWQLALDVAQRSVDTLRPSAKATKKKKKAKSASKKK